MDIEAVSERQGQEQEESGEMIFYLELIIMRWKKNSRKLKGGQENLEEEGMFMGKPRGEELGAEKLVLETYKLK